MRDTSSVTVRCGFCQELNTVQLADAASRPTCASCERPILLDRPIRVTSEDFDRTVLEAEVPVLVDFYADWCAPCKLVAPLIDEIAHERIGRVLVVKVDTDAAQEVALRYEIRSIPTLVLFRGGEEVERSLGFEPERVRGMIEEVVE